MNEEYWSDKSILIIGASSDLCTEMLPVFGKYMGKVGLHYNTNARPLIFYEKYDSVRVYQQDFFVDRNYERIVYDFINWAGRLDFLIIMTGNCTCPKPWTDLTEKDMSDDYYINTIVPMQIANYAKKYMMTGSGGRIVFTGTASSQNAGGSKTLSYGAAKLALECIMKRMAKDLAQDNILVNMVNPGFINSKLNTRLKTPEEIAKRAEYIPLKRPGTYKEVAAAYFYLLSEGASFVTGEVLNVKGGDWL